MSFQELKNEVFRLKSPLKKVLGCIRAHHYAMSCKAQAPLLQEHEKAQYFLNPQIKPLYFSKITYLSRIKFFQVHLHFFLL